MCCKRTGKYCPGYCPKHCSGTTYNHHTSFFFNLGGSCFLSSTPPVHHSQFSSPSTATLYDCRNQRLSKGICQNFWNILKSADRAIFATGWVILSRIDEWCLMKCSDPDLNICLQQILKDSVRLQRSLKKKNLGFGFFLFPLLRVLSSYILNRFQLVLQKLLGANRELLP